MSSPKMSRAEAKRILTPEVLCAIVLPNAPQRRIRDFFVVDLIGAKNFSDPCCIWHLPGGRFRGFSCDFETAVEMLVGHPERDDELIGVIYGTKGC